MDDVGLHLAERRSAAAQTLGRGLVSGMPYVLTVLSVVGTAAMLWVGGGIVIHGLHELGWHGPGDLLHAAQHAVAHAAGPLGGALGWLAGAALSALVGLVLGGIIAFVLHKVLRLGAPHH
jgi:predicted DNA repair protein MutK